MLARCLLSRDATEEVRIFYSYSRQDSDFRQMIDDMLSRFKWDVEVRTWYDGEIPAGSEWEERILRNIDAADIILLFVTRRFASSKYCQEVEIPRALERHMQGEATVIPVLVEDVDVSALSPSLQRLQFLPQNGVPLTAWADQEDAVRKVIQGIVDIIASLTLDPAGRCRWQVRFGTAPEQLDDQLELQIVEDLRSHADDSSLRPLALGQGSIVMLVESSQEGLSRFKGWYREESKPRIAGLDVAEVLELFGAGVQATAVETAEEKTEEREESELLLFPSPAWTPPIMRGVAIPDEKPLSPDFFVDSGDDKLGGHLLGAESARLIDYFSSAVSAPENELWVNLSPDESNRMLGKSLEGTRLGRCLLEEDLKLKRLAASLLHPDTETGKEFWDEVFARNEVGPRPGCQEFTTFQRIWIVAQTARVYVPAHEEGKRSVFLVEQHLKAMSEDAYISKYATHGPLSTPDTNEVCTPIFNRIILPVIEEEVNEGKNFADFRQIFSCVVLATWFKEHFRHHPRWGRFIESGEPGQLVHSIEGIRPTDFKELLDLPGDKRGPRQEAEEPEEVHDSDPRKEDRREESLRKAKRLREKGRLDASARLLTQLAEDLLASHGLESQLTQEVKSELGTTLRVMGRLNDAREQHSEVLAIRRYMLGDDHPYTINSMTSLADILEKMGDTTAAECLREEIAERRSRTAEAFTIRENREFYEKYMRIFRKGVFRLTRNEYRHDSDTSIRISRSYFSGAIDLRSIPLRRA